MKRILSIVILCQFVTNQSFADKSTYLDQGSITPYDGFLLDRDKASKIRLLDLNYQESLKTQEFLTKDNELYVKRLDNISKENDKLASQLAESRDKGIWSSVGYFLLGAGITTALSFGLARATR